MEAQGGVYASYASVFLIIIIIKQLLFSMKEGKVEFGGFILFRKILVILILKDS